MAGVHLNVVFPPLNMGLIEISRKIRRNKKFGRFNVV